MSRQASKIVKTDSKAALSAIKAERKAIKDQLAEMSTRVKAAGVAHNAATKAQEKALADLRKAHKGPIAAALKELLNAEKQQAKLIASTTAKLEKLAAKEATLNPSAAA